jgi:hypothetical protein
MLRKYCGGIFLTLLYILEWYLGCSGDIADLFGCLRFRKFTLRP